MTTSVWHQWFDKPDIDGLGTLALLGSVEAILVIGYIAYSGTTVTEVRYLVYPFIWINVIAYAVIRVRPPTTDPSRLAIGGTVALAYFGVLAWLTGMVGWGHGGALDLRVASAVPGWGPIVSVSGPITGVFIPFEVIGYLGLSYLVGLNAIALSRKLFSGLLGVASCVGCTVPVLVPLVGALGGPSSGLATTAYAWSYDLGTVIFVVTAWLLLRGARAGSG